MVGGRGDIFPVVDPQIGQQHHQLVTVTHLPSERLTVSRLEIPASIYRLELLYNRTVSSSYDSSKAEYRMIIINFNTDNGQTFLKITKKNKYVGAETASVSYLATV